MQRTRRPVRARIVALVVALVLVGLACKPIPHPSFVVVDDAPSVHVVGLSGDGNYTVVTSTAASASVPGAGLWRVDRRDDTAVQLPEGAKFERISDDGQRISYRVPEGFRVWVEGTIVTPPLNTVMSDDLRFGIFVGFFDRVLRRWELATNARTVIDTGGFVPQQPLEISDDGNLARYTDSVTPGEGCRAYFVDLTTAESFIHPCPLAVTSDLEHVLQGFDYLCCDDPYGLLEGVGGPSRLQVHSARQPGTVLQEVSTVGSFFGEIHFAGSPPAVWAADVLAEGTVPPECGGMAGPPCTFHTETLSVVTASLFDQRRFDVDPDMARFSDQDPMRSSVSDDGRFLAYKQHVLDRAWGRDEVLTGASSSAPEIFSDDGRVIVSGPDAPGWYEYLAADA